MLSKNRAVRELFLNSLHHAPRLDRNHNKKHTNNIFLLFHLFILHKSTVQSHKLHKGKNSGKSELWKIFYQHTIIIINRLIIFCFHCFIYIYFINRSFEVIGCLVQLLFGTSKGHQVVSAFILIKLKRSIIIIKVVCTMLFCQELGKCSCDVV